MSIAWSILIIVIGGIVALAVDCITTGAETVRGAQRYADQMIDERRRGEQR